MPTSSQLRSSEEEEEEEEMLSAAHARGRASAAGIHPVSALTGTVLKQTAGIQTVCMSGECPLPPLPFSFKLTKKHGLP